MRDNNTITHKRKLHFWRNDTGLKILFAGLLIIASLIGYNMYHISKQHTTSEDTAATRHLAAAQVSPYQGWETASLQYEKATFKYPASWTYTNRQWNPSVTPGITDPYDEALLVSPDGLKVLLQTGGDNFNNPSPLYLILAIQPITTLGGSYSLTFYTLNAATPPLTSGACVTATNTPGPLLGYINSKTMTQKHGDIGAPALDNFCVESSNRSGETVSQFIHDSSFADAKRIIESVTYQ